jgi:FG-GAP-like repeat
LSASRLSTAALSLFLLVGCTALPVIEANVCGNGVLEPEAQPPEDCDSFVDLEKTPGAVCRAKGLPGECHFDCQPDAEGKRATCPSDMGCGSDGICRRATEDFTARVKLSSDPSSWLSTLDFDGDGHLELLSAEPADQFQQARFRLHYFDALGDLRETRTFPRVATRPIARKFDEGDTDDLIFSNFRIGMLPGRADRDWVPATFSSYVIANSDLRVVGVRDDVVGDASALAAFTINDGVWGVYVPSIVDGGKLSARATFPRPVDELAGAPIAADIVVGDDSPCNELVFAFQGEKSFRVLDMCQVGQPGPPQLEVLWRDTPREQVVSMPAGVKIDSGPMAADVDGDGHVDVLIGAGGKTYVARGDGAGLQDVAQGPFTLPVFGADEPFELPMPLAAGDVSGDGVADFVLPEAVLTSRKSLTDGSVGYFQSYNNRAEPWSMAEILDLNGNALPDIVAAAAGAPGLTFLNGTGGPYQIPARLSSHGPVRFLTTGDFDGDLIGDVAFVEDGPPRQQTDQLSVAFGARDGTPLPATRVAELSGVEQLSDHRQQGLDELFTASREVVAGKSSATLTLFDGNPDRLPFAPYSLVSFSQDGHLQDWGADALAVGAFTARGANDVVALGMNDPQHGWNLWLIPNIGGEKQPPLLLTADAPPQGALPLTQQQDGAIRLSVASTAADLEGDGFDEALWLMPQGPQACVLLRYDIDGGSSEATVRSQLAFDEPCATPELVAADLNGDHWLDLLLLLGDPEVGPRRLEVLWNDGQGGFSLDDRSFIGDAKQSDVRAFSVFPQPDQRVAFVTSSSLHVASTSPGGQAFDVVKDIKGFDDARAVTVTDANADKIADVVVADAEGLWLVGAKLQ